MSELLTAEQVERLADQICDAGWREEFTFSNKANRDAVASACTFRGARVRLWSIRNQLLDPRYTYEGRHLPDKGLGNDHVMFPALYHLERTL